MNRAFCTAVLLTICLCASPQQIRKMDFRNQGIVDILSILAETAGESIIVDQSVTGTVSFHFSDSTFEDALSGFSSACNLFWSKQNSGYFVTKIFVDVSGGEDHVSVSASDVDIELLVKRLATGVSKTILYDDLPNDVITVNLKDSSLDDVLSVIVRKYPLYSIVKDAGSYYIKKEITSGSPGSVAGGRVNVLLRKEPNGTYTLSAQRGNLSVVLAQLFKLGGREYSMLQKADIGLENLYFSGKEFEQLLKLVLEQANCDFVVKDGIFYIFEIQRKDVLKNLKDTQIITLKNISVTDLGNLLPSELSGSVTIKLDTAQNAVYLTGSGVEISPVKEFIERIDTPMDDRHYAVFSSRFLPIKDLISVLPKKYLQSSPIVIPNTNSFILQVTGDGEGGIRQYIDMVDRKKDFWPIYLHYIQSDALVKYLPPSVNKDEIMQTDNPNMVFFSGSEDKYKGFLDSLAMIDRPAQQIRYQMLIVQYQKNDSLNWTKSIGVGASSDSPGTTLAGTMSSLLTISYDVVSKFGYSFASKLSSEITENRARVLADTTINGISGEPITFQNTTTSRYSDTSVNAETNVKSTTTREIVSGIVLKINGWVSGADMITMTVNAQVSKQTESDSSSGTTTVIPGTSEKSVTTKVRTQSGTSIVIGGLLQLEKSVAQKRIPILGNIPLIGILFQDLTTSEETTELVIYITPCLYSSDGLQTDIYRNIETYYQKYISPVGSSINNPGAVANNSVVTESINESKQ